MRLSVAVSRCARRMGAWSRGVKLPRRVASTAEIGRARARRAGDASDVKSVEMRAGAERWRAHGGRCGSPTHGRPRDGEVGERLIEADAGRARAVDPHVEPRVPWLQIDGGESTGARSVSAEGRSAHEVDSSSRSVGGRWWDHTVGDRPARLGPAWEQPQRLRSEDGPVGRARRDPGPRWTSRDVE